MGFATCFPRLAFHLQSRQQLLVGLLLSVESLGLKYPFLAVPEQGGSATVRHLSSGSPGASVDVAAVHSLAVRKMTVTARLYFSD